MFVKEWEKLQEKRYRPAVGIFADISATSADLCVEMFHWMVISYHTLPANL